MMIVITEEDFFLENMLNSCPLILDFLPLLVLLINRFVSDDCKMFHVTGEMNSSVPVHISVERHTVIFMTAQILVNLLR